MKELLESLKINGKRGFDEVEFQFLLYFHNVITNSKYNSKINNFELIKFKNYISDKTIDEIKEDLLKLFKNKEIGYSFIDNQANNVFIASDFLHSIKGYPNIINIKNSIIYSNNIESQSFLEFQNNIFNLNNKIYNVYNLDNNLNELYKDLNNTKYVIIPFDVISNTTNENISNFFNNIDLNTLLKEKDLILVGDYKNLKLDKKYLMSSVDGTLLFNLNNKVSCFDFDSIKSIPYDFISKFPTYSPFYIEKINDTILNIICEKYKITNKKENVENYVNCVYENYRDYFDKDVLEYKEKKLLELEKIKNEIDNIEDFFSNRYQVLELE